MSSGVGGGLGDDASGGLSRRTVTGLVLVLTLVLLAGGAAVVASALGGREAPRDAVASSGPVAAPGTHGPAPTPKTSASRPLVTVVPLPSPSLVVVPPSAPSSPPTSVGPATPAAPAPTVTLSAVWIGSGNCPSASPFLYRVQWSTTDAETAILSGTGGSEVVALDGETQRCGLQTAQFTLTATGPGGETAETVDAQAIPAG